MPALGASPGIVNPDPTVFRHGRTTALAVVPGFGVGPDRPPSGRDVSSPRTRPRKGARIVAPGASPGTRAVNHGKPRTGRRKNRSIEPRPMETFHPFTRRRLTLDTSLACFPASAFTPPKRKTGAVPYGKKLEAVGNSPSARPDAQRPTH